MSEERISTSLYELSDALQRAILDGVDPDTGELLEGWEERLDSLEGDVRAKSIQVALYIKGLMTEAAACDAVGHAISDQAKARYEAGTKLVKQAQSLTAYLDRNLQAVEIDEVKDPRVTIKYRKSTAIEVLAPELVPEHLRGEVKLPPPSKTLIKQEMDERGLDILCTDTDEDFARREYRRTIKIT